MARLKLCVYSCDSRKFGIMPSMPMYVTRDSFVSDIEDARILTNKVIKTLLNIFSIGDEMFCEELDEFIILESIPLLEKIN